MKYNSAKLVLDDQTINIPLMESSTGKQSLDIRELAFKTGLHAFDPTLNNTAITKSGISWIDAEHNNLYYRGYNVEDLVNHSTFVETAFLLSNGNLPNAQESQQWSDSLTKHSMVHEAMKNIFDVFPGRSHPMAILATMVAALASYYPNTHEENLAQGIDIRTRLISSIRTLAAWSYKKSVGQPLVYPKDNLRYCQNLLNMMFATPMYDYQVPEGGEKLLNQLLILYSDHEINVSTATVLLVGSTKANLFASISSGLSSLWGTRESGSNITPFMMFNAMVDNAQTPEKYFEKYIQGRDILRSNGFGHASYKGEDPRSRMARKVFHDYRKNHLKDMDALINKALEVEEYVMSHHYFRETGLYPNLDFYSALSFHILGVPVLMNNVIRTIGKLSGWIAHWQEMHDQDTTTYRPSQFYDGPTIRKYQPLEQRT